MFCSILLNNNDNNNDNNSSYLYTFIYAERVWSCVAKTTINRTHRETINILSKFSLRHIWGRRMRMRMQGVCVFNTSFTGKIMKCYWIPS